MGAVLRLDPPNEEKFTSNAICSQAASFSAILKQVRPYADQIPGRKMEPKGDAESTGLVSGLHSK